LLGILRLQERNGLLVSEATDLVTVVFRKFVADSAPKIEQQASRYWDQAAADAASAARLAGEQRERYYKRLADEKAAREAKAEAEKEERFKNFLTENEKYAKELADARAREKICQ
jgi:hypothetical protein